jgi:hypothetical protein
MLVRATRQPALRWFGSACHPRRDRSIKDRRSTPAKCGKRTLPLTKATLSSPRYASPSSLPGVAIIVFPCRSISYKVPPFVDFLFCFSPLVQSWISSLTCPLLRTCQCPRSTCISIIKMGRTCPPKNSTTKPTVVPTL